MGLCVPLGPGFEPGSPKWLGTVSASKIAAIAEVQGAFGSRETEMRRMLGLEPPRPVTDAMRVGQEMEPLIRGWCREKWTDTTVVECGGLRDKTEPRFTATPDGLLLRGVSPFAVLEIKYATGGAKSWERKGVPEHYVAQVQWQMLITGLSFGYLTGRARASASSSSSRSRGTSR